ncbi:type III pantothenate kinase [Halospina sp. K52047b]|uniref:type III pantothenate kinase n=1 Tax=Halospina sp. K52047b TaxID=2614160 RepID=UPI00124A9EA2|nr:type III pantothenate kinase [Halospina sp. K52047b]KAA8982609.1 type III pantothenate kinase [Halospina sp. K52047b]
MILQVDAGNSRVHWRCLDMDRLVIARGDQPWETIGSDGIAGVDSDRLAWLEFASVAGDRANQLKANLVSGNHVRVMEFAASRRQCGVVNAYNDPAQMGVDRWLAMLGAYSTWEGPITVLDAGTAITVDHVDASGNHQGGYILPGGALMAQSLGAGTSGVRPEAVAGADTAPGITTSECVHHGIAWLMQALVARSADYWQGRGTMIVTGGDAAAAASGLPTEQVVEPDLVFLGMDAVMAEAGGSR